MTMHLPITLTIHVWYRHRCRCCCIWRTLGGEGQCWTHYFIFLLTCSGCQWAGHNMQPCKSSSAAQMMLIKPNLSVPPVHAYLNTMALSLIYNGNAVSVVNFWGDF